MKRSTRMGALALAIATCEMAAPHAATERGSLDAVLRVIGDRGTLRSAALGDVNGDGHNDVIVRTHCGEPSRGDVNRVVYGPIAKDVDVSEAPGFDIVAPPNNAQGSGGRACWPNPGGDVNDDGLADILIGSPFAYNGNGSGSIYVIFGKAVRAGDVLLATFQANAQGLDGYRIDAAGGRDLVGRHASNLGDVNGDGRDDLVTNAMASSSAYVVFGKSTPEPIDLTLFENGVPAGLGYRIDFPSVEDSSTLEVGAAGDVNGDGVPDAAIGYSFFPRRYKFFVAVVFGKSDPAPLDTRSLGEHGFVISKDDIRTGGITMGLGDVNGDGLDDLGISHRPVAIYVVFGKKGTSAIRLEALQKNNRGFKIVAPRDGRYLNDGAGQLAAPGDIDRDGRADIATSAILRSPDGIKFAGVVYVVYGKKSSAPVYLAALEKRGYKIKGRLREGWLGHQLAAGRVNGDRRGDLLMGTVRNRVFIHYGRRGR